LRLKNDQRTESHFTPQKRGPNCLSLNRTRKLLREGVCLSVAKEREGEFPNPGLLVGRAMQAEEPRD